MHFVNTVGMILGTVKVSTLDRSEGENGEGFPSYGHAQYTLIMDSHEFGVVHGDRVVG